MPGYPRGLPDDLVRLRPKSAAGCSGADSLPIPEHQKRPYLFTWPAKHFEALYANLAANGEIYKADNITKEDCYDIWPQIREADAAEIKQFVETSSFQKILGHCRHRQRVGQKVEADSRWVKKVKSRLCARGCFDKQKDPPSYDPLHHRDTLVTEDLSFSVRERGRGRRALRHVRSPVRKVVIVAPADAWRHFASFDAKFKVDVNRLGDYVLFCLMATSNPKVEVLR